MIQAKHVEVYLFEQVIAQVEVPQARQVTEDSFVIETTNFILLQMELGQLCEVAIHEDVVQILGELCRCVVGKGVGQVKLHQIDKVREHSWMMVIDLVVSRNAEIVVIEYESLHIRHMMIALSTYLSDMVIAHVDNCQIY